MTHTLRLDADIPEDRRVAFTLPNEAPRSTGQDLLNSEGLGTWKDRTDIDDSAEYAREQRERAWKRAE